MSNEQILKVIEEIVCTEWTAKAKVEMIRYAVEGRAQAFAALGATDRSAAKPKSKPGLRPSENSQRKRVLAVLSDGVPRRGHDVARRSGVPISSTWSYLSEAVKKGVIQRVAQGVYQVQR